MILGLMLEYYIGINGHVSRRQVHYAVEEAAMPFYLVESLCLFVLPIATLCAYCLESIVYKKEKSDILHVLSFKQIFLKFAFCVYACIVIAKIIQISYFGEWISMEQGSLYFYAPCPIKNAILLVISTSCIGRHFFWLLDSLAVSYVILHDCYHSPSLSVRLNVQPVMKKHLYVLAFLAMLGFVSCTNTAPKSNSEVVSKNATYAKLCGVFSSIVGEPNMGIYALGILPSIIVNPSRQTLFKSRLSVGLQ